MLRGDRGSGAGEERSYLAAVQAYPGYADAHSNLGVLRGDRGDGLGAEQRYLAAVQADLGCADSGQSQPGARQGRVRRAIRGHKKWDVAEPAD